MPRALRQRLGEGAGVRRRLYSLQQTGAEVCVVAVVVRRRKRRRRRQRRRQGGARYDSWRVLRWDASVKGVALVTTWTAVARQACARQEGSCWCLLFWTRRRRPDKQDRGRGCALRPSLRIDWQCICSGIAVPQPLVIYRHTRVRFDN